MRTFLSTKRHLFAPLVTCLVATQAAGCFSDDPPVNQASSTSETGSTTTPETTTGASTSSTGSATDTDGAELCGAPDSNSYYAEGQCFCQVGHQWCTSDPDDYTCCATSPPEVCDGPYNQKIGDDCFCVSGYEWCSDEPSDYTCCEVGDTSNTSDTSDTGMCQAMPPPDTCDPQVELAWCSTTTQACLTQSEYYACSQDGTWAPSDGTAECEFNGYDFSYGCIDDSEQVLFICGSGPGTPCDDRDLDSCADKNSLLSCTYSKLGAIDCLSQCQNVGDSMGVTYDFGSCGMQDGVSQCLCCDMDEPGCGV